MILSKKSATFGIMHSPFGLSQLIFVFDVLVDRLQNAACPHVIVGIEFRDFRERFAAFLKPFQPRKNEAIAAQSEEKGARLAVEMRKSACCGVTSRQSCGKPLRLIASRSQISRCGNVSFSRWR